MHEDDWDESLEDEGVEQLGLQGDTGRGLGSILNEFSSLLVALVSEEEDEEEGNTLEGMLYDWGQVSGTYNRSSHDHDSKEGFYVQMSLSIQSFWPEVWPNVSDITHVHTVLLKKMDTKSSLWTYYFQMSYHSLQELISFTIGLQEIVSDPVPENTERHWEQEKTGNHFRVVIGYTRMPELIVVWRETAWNHRLTTRNR